MSLDADIALSLTGVAGPSGGTAEKPVGTVYLMIASAGKGTLVKHRVFPGEFLQIQTLASYAGLHLAGRRAGARRPTRGPSRAYRWAAISSPTSSRARSPPPPPTSPALRGPCDDHEIALTLEHGERPEVRSRDADPLRLLAAGFPTLSASPAARRAKGSSFEAIAALRVVSHMDRSYARSPF